MPRIASGLPSPGNGSDRYGTRASTVVAIGYDGVGVIIERRFGPGGRFEGLRELSFGLLGDD